MTSWHSYPSTRPSSSAARILGSADNSTFENRGAALPPAPRRVAAFVFKNRGAEARSLDLGSFIADFVYVTCLHLVRDDEGKVARAVELVNSGFVETYAAVIESADFFSWPLTIRAKILAGLMSILDYAIANPDARERVCRTTTSLFKSIWDRRAIVRLSDPGIRHLGGVVDDTAMLGDLVSVYYQVYSNCDRAPPIDTYIHHVHLLIWVLSREEDGIPGIKLHEKLVILLYSAWGPSLQDMEKAELKFDTPQLAYLEVQGRLVEESIVHGIGPDRFIDACETEILGFLAHLGCKCGNGVHDIRLLGRHVVSSLNLMPTLHRRDLLLSALDVLKQLFVEEFGTGMCTSLFVFCSHLVTLYRVYSQVAEVQVAAPHRHSDVVDLLVIGIELVAAGNSTATISQGDLQGMVVGSLEAIMMWMQDDIDAQGGDIPEYLLPLRLRASLYWHPALRRIQLASRPAIAQEGDSDSSCTPVSALLDHWLAFGTRLGLDPDEERRRHEQDRLRCWWRGCQCKPMKDDTTIKLLQCAGCGEVRYCSKQCQRLDWTTGGHKKMCRRLK